MGVALAPPGRRMQAWHTTHTCACLKGGHARGTQGMGVAEMDTIADMIDRAVTGDEADRRTVRGEVSELVERFPVYPRPAS